MENSSLREFHEETMVAFPREFAANYNHFNSCAATTIGVANEIQYFSPPVDILLKTVQIIYTSFIVVFGSFLSGLVVGLVITLKKLRTVSLFIAIQVCVNDICLCIAYGIPVIINEVTGYPAVSASSCAFLGFLLILFIFLRDFLLFLFSINKFLPVFCPLFYRKHGFKVVMTISVVSLFVCVVLSIIFVPGLVDCYGHFEVVQVCIFIPTCSNICKTLSYILVFVGSVGTVAPVVLYFGMFIKGKQMQLRTLSQNEHFVSKKDWKASKTLAIVFLVFFLIIKLPYVLYITLIFTKNIASYIVLKVSFNVVFICVITDPLIMMREPSFKEQLKTLIKKIKHCN